MKRRYTLAPDAALDLVEIWRYIKSKVGIEMAGRVESVIREKVSGRSARSGALASRFDG